uniref:Hint domain-containing protein n=1 Tax=Haloactinopolyspora sp. TaxID=1966353 RepID=UPI00261B66F6
QPGWQWMVSFFQRATAAVAGEVTVTTSAGTAYSATFTTTLDSAGWDRLYDALNLIGDTSAAFGLSFTFTGGAGQTVWLDGLMLSPFYGRPSVLPSFQNGSAPLLLDNNPDGFYSKILSSRTAGNVAFNFRGAWSSAASYLTGDEVVYGPTYWVALADSTNVQPATGVSAWQAVGSYSEFVGAWSSTATYAVGAEVTYSGSYWVAVVQNSNSAPSTTNANWQIAGSTSASAIVYTDGATVQSLQPAEASADVTATHTSNDTSNVNGVASSSISPIANLMPAEAGADVTATHTSNDTSNVNGVAAATISQGAGRANAAIDSTNVVVSSGVDFSRPYTNKTLTNIPDGAGRYAVTNIGGGNAVSYVDGNNRALIDFSQSGHLYKSLQYLSDGGGRYAVTNIAGGNAVSYVDGNNRALIDFSQSGHLNKGALATANNADGVPAGTSFAIPTLHVGAEGLVENGDFLNGFAGWVPLSGAEVQTGNGPFTNAQYAAFTAPQHSNMHTQRSYACTPGDVYLVVGWLWQSAANAATLGLLCFDGSGSELSAPFSPAFAATDTWTYVRAQITIPANCAYFIPYVAQFASGSNEVLATAINVYKVRGLDNEVSDGTLFARFPYTHFDGLTYRRIATINGAVSPLGSIVTGSSTITLSYTSTDNSITISWTAGNLNRMDGSQTAVTSGSVTVTGLAASTKYYAAAYWDEVAQAISFVTGQSGAVGSPAILYPSEDPGVAWQAQLQARLNLGWVPVGTAASGGTGGGGGSSGCCLRGPQLIELASGVMRQAQELTTGDVLSSPDGPIRITQLLFEPWAEWYRVEFNDGRILEVAPDHRFMDPSGVQIHARDLKLQTIVEARNCYLSVARLELCTDRDIKVGIEVEEPHVYYVDGVLSHNKVYC